jgi:hypothetical protein
MRRNPCNAPTVESNLSQKPKLRIDWATHEAAKYAVENWHYSRTMPTNKLVKVGAWEDKKFIGVVIFGPGATPTLCMTYNLNQQECCELVRVALRKDHVTPVSRVVAIAIRFLKKANPGLRLIISFADMNRGHYGGIYQAGNWIYVGTGGPKQVPYLNGEQIHERTLSILVKSGKVKRSDCKWMPVLPKHKYLMPLDEGMREQLASLAKPYPKRAGSKDSVASGFQSEEGGANPTPALQTPDSQKNA